MNMNAHAEGRVIIPPSNAAWRCRQFVLAALTNASQHVDVAFATALGIQAYDPNNPDQQDLVRAAITSLRQQQRGIIMALNDHPSLMPELFAPINEANSALSSMSNLHQVLTNFPQFTSNGYALALGWAANILPSSGHSSTDMETAQILNDIIALKARLTGMRFPSAVHDFMEQLLRDLETGVVTASFEGTGAMNRAYSRAVSEVSVVEAQLRSAEPSLNEAQRSYLTEAAEKVEKVGKIAGGLTAAIGFAQKLVPLIAGAVS